jgi:iron complex outermembrane receptor protein
MKIAAVSLVIFSVLGFGSAFAQQPETATGVVVDSTGGAISGATVIVRQPPAADHEVVTGADGQFTFPVDAGPAPIGILVRVPGFAESRTVVTTAAARLGLRIVVRPSGLAELVTVTPARAELARDSVPASVSVMSREEIQRSPAAIADDVLRRLPAFSLFRRTSSVAAHPTAQGVSLRGIGPSGVSRTLVLLDGIPFNDPFGGWVHWTRVPLDQADRIEVVDGASSSLYGSYAMGGVINIVSRPPTRRTLELRTQYGTMNSPKFDLRASDVWGRWSASVDLSAFDTEGFMPVVAEERGPVDTRAAVQFANINARLNYAVRDNVDAFVQAGYFREDRDNGKVSTINGTPEANATRWRTVAGGLRARLAGGDDIQARLFVDSEDFTSNFLAVTNATGARDVGRMSLDQQVPTTAVGASLQWGRSLNARHALSAGLDWRRVTGESQEQVLDFVRGETPVTLREAGGTQQSVGLFVQDIFEATDALTITLSGRIDHWSNTNGHHDEISAATGNPTANHQPDLPSRSDTVFSPRVGALYAVNDRVSVWASAGRGFRAPTLNELYRQFRVGSVVTLANHELGPERLTGTEAGVRLFPTRDVTVRATWFDNRVSDPVSNVTISSTPELVTQHRQNLGRTHIYGLQTDAEYRLSPEWHVSAGWLYSHATVTEFEANPSIIGNFLPQVPRHRASFGVTYTNPRIVDLSIDVQAVGSQFDDDRNERTVPGYSKPGLPKYAVVSLLVSRRLNDSIDVFAGAQNLFDQQYFVGTLPTTVGSPRMVTAGLRVRITGR